MIQLKWEGDAGSININGTKFFLHQAHWHSPSEHTINGRRFVFASPYSFIFFVSFLFLLTSEYNTRYVTIMHN